MKDFLKAMAIVAVFVTILMILPFKGCAPVNTTGVKDNEGLIVYSYVNFRTEPTTDNDDNIICQIKFGETVTVLEKGKEWSKVKYNGKEGYIINESVTTEIVMLDVSDFNWGSEYKNIEQFKAFAERARGSVKFAGFYIQVQRTFKENAHWKELTACLDEMDILQLRNLRDFTVLHLGRSEKREDWDRMSAITHVIDSRIFDLGGEV